MNNIKILLITSAPYSSCYDDLLVSFLQKGCELFCVVGEFSIDWEEAMDELSVGDGTNPQFIVTTSHVSETVEEVIEFANNYRVSRLSDVDVVRI